jgi:transcriptional regulator with XRE-family HTH domain
MATVGTSGKIGRPRERQLTELGRRIEARLLRRHMSVSDLEAKTGVDRQTIYAIMSGQTAEPKASTLSKIAIGLGTTRDKLAGDLF